MEDVVAKRKEGSGSSSEALVWCLEPRVVVWK